MSDVEKMVCSAELSDSLLALSLGHLRKAQEVVEQLAAMDQHEDIPRSPDRCRSELVFRLLLGDTSSAEVDRLGYELDSSWHLGIVAMGSSALDVLSGLKASLGRELLVVSNGPQVWAWFGGLRQFELGDIERMLSNDRHSDVSLACGGSCKGIRGWHLTHRQALEAHRVATHRPQRVTWYVDVPLLAAALRNDTLAQSLQLRYMVPLRSQKDGGVALRETLRAYIEAGCNITSASSRVKVGRRGVEGRIHTIEGLIGRTIRGCLAELDVALRLEELSDLHAGRIRPEHRAKTL